MTKIYIFLLSLIFAFSGLQAQTTETFETESVGSTSFTDNGQVFHISSQAPAIFDVFLYSGGGWNGTSVDNRFIDNSGTTYFNTPVEFTISTANQALFELKSIYLYLSKSDLGLSVSGSLTITGKRGGATVYSVSVNSPFNTSMGVNNGFTYINMANFGGVNNSSATIDQYVVKTTGNIAYVSLDAMTWKAACSPVTVAQASQTNVSCFGGSNGSATVTAANGPGLTYNWSPGNPPGDGTPSVTGLTAGNWTCTVTNACGNSNSVTISITEPQALTATQSQTNITCNGGNNGSATINVSGGAGSYTYSWAPFGGNAATASNLTAGSYTVTVTDANNCSTQRSFTITAPSALTATQSQTNITCSGGNNGSASVSVSGGAGTYTYAWAPFGGNAATASNLAAGNYTVTVTDANNCSIQRSFTITAPTAITATQSQTNITCSGGSNGSATINVSGGAGAYSYLWAPSGGTGATASNLTEGSYTVTVTDANNCSIQRNFTISAPPALTATQSQTNNNCSNSSTGSATVNVSGGAGEYSYLWAPSGGTGATASNLTAGTYTVTVTDANSCSIQRSFTITAPTALTATQSQTDVTCNNSNNGTATVAVSGGTGSYTYAWFPSGGNGPAATGLAPGFYIVFISDANGCSIQKQFTIGTATCSMVTWNGTGWSNTTGPDTSSVAIIDGDYSGPAFAALSLTVNAGKTLNVTDYVTTGDVTNNGHIIVADGANFVQTGTFTAGTDSSFKVRKSTKAVKRLAYINWSSPMNNSAQTLKEFSFGKNADGSNQSATGTVDNRFFTYNNNAFVSILPGSTFNPAGAGFLIRTPNDFTTTGQVFNGQFEGTTPNSGTISYDHSGIAGDYVMLGNPYPSAISLDDFLTANPGTTETVYIWNSQAVMDANNQYTGTNYNTYAPGTGSVPAGSINGFIPVGQAFFVERATMPTTTPFVFTDALRQITQDGVFSRGATADKFWLELTSPSGSKPQMLIGFNAAATAGFDAGFDAALIGSNADALYSTVDNRKLVIDAHGSFTSDDSFVLNADVSTAGSYTIGVLKTEGVFANGQQIWLKDQVTGSVTLISEQPYTFTAEAGSVTDRLTLQFKPGGALATDGAVKAGITIFSSGSEIHARAAEHISSVEVYEMSGKLIANARTSQKDVTVQVNYQGVVLVKVVLQNGTVQTKKLMLK
ncbi:PKD domain containing protein [Flavobacteriaceae bacterium 3519-10]|nr:PKD domain containing protein [Flavobacteriaceae bacterium 3519-10]